MAQEIDESTQAHTVALWVRCQRATYTPVIALQVVFLALIAMPLCEIAIMPTRPSAGRPTASHACTDPLAEDINIGPDKKGRMATVTCH